MAQINTSGENIQFNSQRNVHYAKSAMVATSHPLAAQAGLDIIKKGGNAIDAAIATAAMLTVVEPTSNGIGGDAFALVWTKKKLYGLNGSGPAPKTISAKKIIDAGYDSIPVYGHIPVTVPGTPATWAELSAKFGKLSLEEVLMPAIETARNGHAITHNVAKNWGKAYTKYKEQFKDPIFEEWFKVFAPEGRAPKAGEIWRSEDHAQTLDALARTKCQSFYSGSLAKKICDVFRTYDGYLEEVDLNYYKPEWVEPISCDYKGYQVCEIPPNGQGISALMALSILKHFELKQFNEPHLLIESTKLAMVDSNAFVSDPKTMKHKTKSMLSDDYASQRAALIGDLAQIPEMGNPSSGGTVYLCTADAEGNMVSYIQSNYMGFGSGIVVPGTGIALHNRGNNFNLIKEHPNCIEGGKKPFHTIIPGFLMKEGDAVGPFGIMGGFMQPQGHVQLITNTLDYQMNPQDALDAPRWQWIKDKTITVEPSFSKEVIKLLIDKGHDVTVESDSGSFGRGQIIWRTADGSYCGGTESRCDGHIASL